MIAITKLLALLASAALLGACNTIDGLGKDVQRAGEKVQSLTKN
ncbi:MAG: entericidin A/B family lipoprotein [Lacisediminimonas sp.]|nr:entericidin A/B family lipoprotein [Lacisediminimonas sp.]MDO8299769.1 entericidin A/B family lipoprotein [Lacisediminimonas sp.]